MTPEEKKLNKYEDELDRLMTIIEKGLKDTENEIRIIKIKLREFNNSRMKQ